MFKKPWQILRNNMLFIQPLLLFLLLVMTGSTFILGRNMYGISKYVLSLSLVLLAVAFTAGWFYINKKGIENYNPDDSQETVAQKAILNFKQFFIGVGENFLKTFFAYILFVFIYAGSVFILGKVCLSLLGEPTIIMQMPKLAQMQTSAELMAYLNSIPATDKLTFMAWVWSGILLSSVMNFFGVLYFVVLNSDKKNAFVALLQTLVFFFKNILYVIAIITFMFFVYFILNVLSLLLGTNSLAFVVLIILFTLYLNYYVLLVFCFYNEKSKNNSNSRTEWIG